MEGIGSACPRHAARVATFVCARCGAFACDEERRIHAATAYCEPCGDRPEFDVVERWRREVEGKRDVLSWLVLLCVPLHLLVALTFLRRGEVLVPMIELSAAWLSIQFFRGKPSTRVELLIAAPLVRVLVYAFAFGETGFIGALMTLAMAIAIDVDGRNQLYFRLPLTPHRLQQAWQLHADNPAARLGLRLALMSLLVCPLLLLSPLVVGLCAYGLSQVDESKSPPVGGRGAAVAGLLLGGLELLMLAALLARGLAPRY
jgi:hypothetical protein